MRPPSFASAGQNNSQAMAPEGGIVTKSLTAAGQIVPAGAQLVEIANLSTVWIRVPVYVGELDGISASRSAMVHGINESATSAGRAARRVPGIPGANAAAATVDLYYEIANPQLRFKPGERVGVTFASDQEQSLVVPWSAVINDVNGGTWVYENIAPQTYTRRRVEVRFRRDNEAVLRRGIPAGAKIVKSGVAELFGTEFGVGK